MVVLNLVISASLLDLMVVTSGVGRDSRDGNFPGIPGFSGHFPEFPGKRGRESRDFPGNPGKMVIFGIPVSRELKIPGKSTPLDLYGKAYRHLPARCLNRTTRNIDQ